MYIKEVIRIKLDKYLQYGKGISNSIFIAVLTNDTKYIVKYYESGSDIFILDEREQTLLHLAARNKAIHSMELLLELGLNPNIGDKYNETPLHIVSFMGAVDLVKLLLENNADPNHTNNSFQTPLHRAAFKGSVEVINLLLDYHANIYAVDENHTSVIQYAVRSKKIKGVKLLTSRGAIVNSLDSRLQSTHHYAALYSTVDIAEYLIELGVNPYSKNHYQFTPLHLAIEHPHSDMVSLFLKHGLTSYDKNKYGQSPYDLAILKNSYESVEIFNRLKNDKEYQAKLRSNPLAFSIVMNEFDKADSLIPISDVNDPDIFGNTPLYYAIMNREPYLVERLLQHNANICNIDSFKDSAIYYATIVGDIDIIRHLQKKEIDYTKKYGGYTVLELANHNQNIEVYEILKKGSQQWAFYKSSSRIVVTKKLTKKWTVIGTKIFFFETKYSTPSTTPSPA